MLVNNSQYSLRKRLLLWISLPVLIIFIAIIIMAFIFTRKEVEEVYDAQMVHIAKTLLQITEHELIELDTVSIPLGEERSDLKHRYENKTVFRIWYNNSVKVQSSRADKIAGVESPPGFSEQKVKGKTWRFFVYVDQLTGLKVEVAQRSAIRYELIGQLMSSLIIPMAILIPSLLLIVWIGVRKSLMPLIALSSDVDAREIDDLKPIAVQEIPKEVTPLVFALNRLFARIEDSFKREREFTDHAAHELRTPLAAMKTQTQVLMKKASNMPGWADGLENLHVTIDRATHLVEQLLYLARLQNTMLAMESVNLSVCIEDAICELLPHAKQKRQSITMDIAPDLYISGHSDSLFILVRNLLSNALKYTQEGGEIHVRLSQDKILSIADNGPGIADEDKERVLRRFVRVDKSGQNGSGLGLSIVQWIASAHKAVLSLKDNTPRGLIVDVRFEA